LKHAIIAFVITLIATVVLDLTQAILIGFGISTLIFMAQMSELQISRRPVEVERLTHIGQQFVHPGHNVAVYYLSGPLFFAAARRLLEFVESHDGPDATLILSIRGVPLIDATGVEVIRELLHAKFRTRFRPHAPAPTTASCLVIISAVMRSAPGCAAE
jgi:SulP family sulfate permease